MNKTLSIAMLTLVPMSAMAHPGHDHSHWLSPFLHVMFGVALTVAVGVGIKLLLGKGKIEEH